MTIVILHPKFAAKLLQELKEMISAASIKTSESYIGSTYPTIRKVIEEWERALNE